MLPTALRDPRATGTPVPVAIPAARSAAPAVVAIATLAAAVAVIAAVDRRPTSAAAVAALLALTVVAARSAGGPPALAGQAVPLAAAVAALAIGLCGTVDGADASGDAWRRGVLTLVAYPFLGRAVARLASSLRPVREVDAAVGAALVGIASAVILHVGVADAWLERGGALPSVLVGLDVAVIAVGARAIRAPGAWRGPFGLVFAGTGALLAGHLIQAVDTAAALGSVASLLAASSVVAIGMAAAHPRALDQPDPPTEEPPAFSAAHAAVVVVALLAAPAVLAVQAVRGVTAPATVAAGMVVSGAVLACYLVVLLQERATTEHRASHDPLTGLPNRSLFLRRLERSMARARRTGGRVAVLFVDLDGFKDVNDTFGHAAGDVVLRAVAERLTSCAGVPHHTVARLAGDEFAVLVKDASDQDMAALAQRVLDAIAEPVSVAEERVLLGCSVGVAVHPDDGAEADELLASADAAMYHAKERGGAGFALFHVALATQAHARLRLEAALYDGMERGELVLHYQPIVELATGRTVGAEALVRWEHPEQGLLLPGHFVPVAERSDLVVLLGERVIEEACRELRRWSDLQLPDVSVSVNVSSRHFNHGLASTVAAALRQAGADPRNLVVELTESTAVDNLAAVAGTLEELRQLGVRSAIDDFGTGYCGLRYLGTLPVDALKIDRSFIEGMTASDAAIVAATIAMGHSLGMTLIAEGVETPEQRRFLEAHRCDRVQGWLVGRPMPATDFVDRLREERRTILEADGARGAPVSLENAWEVPRARA